MRFYKNIFIYLCAITVFWLPLSSFWESESNSTHPKSQITSKLGTENKSSINEEQEPKQNYLLKSSSGFSTIILENNNYSVNPLFQQNSKKSNFHTLGIILKKRSAKFFTTIVYISHYKFIYTILKNSNLIYPFHFFK